MTVFHEIKSATSSREESQILANFQYNSPLEALEPVADSNEILEIQNRIKNIHVEESLSDYIVDIVSQTRTYPDVALGSSPRGSLSLFRASQAWAFYNGRDFVIPDDIKKMALPVLTHRLILRQEAKLKKIQPENILNVILTRTKVPVLD